MRTPSRSHDPATPLWDTQLIKSASAQQKKVQSRAVCHSPRQRPEHSSSALFTQRKTLATTTRAPRFLELHIEGEEPDITEHLRHHKKFKRRRRQPMEPGGANGASLSPGPGRQHRDAGGCCKAGSVLPLDLDAARVGGSLWKQALRGPLMPCAGFCVATCQ